MPAETLEPRPRPRLARLVKPVALLTLLAMAWALGPDLFAAWWLNLSAGSRRSLAIGFLNSILIGYGVVLCLSLVAGLACLIHILSARRRRERSVMAPRILLLSLTSLFCLAGAEAGAWVWSLRQRSEPRVESAGSPGSIQQDPARDDRPERDLVLLVLGESSAEGQPYEAWTSIGHMVAWQLEQVRPGRRVRLVMAAAGGANLTQVLKVMNEQTERPDMVLLYAGHNEFQARWGWTRVVDYYPDDVREQVRARLIERVGSWTPLCRMVRDSFETQMIDYDPPPRETRELVDRPVCEPETFAQVRDLFERQVDAVAAWCEARDALPIFVVPAGNDAGFDPDRSVLRPSTSPADRERFASEFRKARRREAADPSGAIEAYRLLIADQEGFAESHFHLARLLRQEGPTAEARREFARARDLDGLPMRCPTGFQDAYRRVADRHDVLLIDAGQVLQTISPTGLLDDNVFHDAQHTTFRGYVALAQGVLDGLAARGAFGLDRSRVPTIDPAECAAHFGIGPEQWEQVCERSGKIWDRLAKLRYEADLRASTAALYQKAARRIASGESAEKAGVPGLGVNPPGFR